MESNRRLTQEEEKLLDFLIEKATINLSDNWKNQLLVSPMDDGDMGSLKIYPNGIVSTSRKFGKQVSEFQFIDSDGVTVIASLNVDEFDELFELDIWKTDFSKLIKFPSI